MAGFEMTRREFVRNTAATTAGLAAMAAAVQSGQIVQAARWA
jgi:hypothetical protein